MNILVRGSFPNLFLQRNALLSHDVGWQKPLIVYGTASFIIDLEILALLKRSILNVTCFSLLFILDGFTNSYR